MHQGQEHISHLRVSFEFNFSKRLFWEENLPNNGPSILKTKNIFFLSKIKL